VSGRGTDIDDRRTVAAIVEAAETLALDHDLSVVPVSTVESMADVDPGSIRSHFGSMEGLSLALAERAFEANIVYMDAAYSSSPDAVEQLRAAARWYVTFHEDHQASFRLLAFPYGPRAHEGPAALIAERIADKIQAQNDRLADTLRGGIAAGLIRPVDPEQAAVFLWAAWNGLVSLRWRPDHLRRDRRQLDELVDLAVDVIANGLLAPPAPTRRRWR
jgi:TetR/AcrR family transcriptional regulator